MKFQLGRNGEALSWLGTARGWTQLKGCDGSKDSGGCQVAVLFIADCLFRGDLEGSLFMATTEGEGREKSRMNPKLLGGWLDTS